MLSYLTGRFWGQRCGDVQHCPPRGGQHFSSPTSKYLEALGGGRRRRNNIKRTMMAKDTLWTLVLLCITKSNYLKGCPVTRTVSRSNTARAVHTIKADRHTPSKPNTYIVDTGNSANSQRKDCRILWQLPKAIFCYGFWFNNDQEVFGYLSLPVILEKQLQLPM